MLDTLANVKTFLDVSASTDDAVITEMIEAAGVSMAGDDGAGRTLESGTKTEVQSGKILCAYRLYLLEPVDPAGIITSIYVSSDQNWVAANLVDADDYYLDADNRQVVERLDATWPRGQRNIRVIYPIGFSAPPENLQYALKVQVARMYSAWKVAQDGRNVVSAETVEGWQRTYLAHTGLDPEVQRILRVYRPMEIL